MSNIFEYRPQLQYILEDINSIDNVKDERIKAMSSYITNGITPVMQKATEVKALLDEVRANIDSRLQGVTVPYKNFIDDITMNRLVDVKDGSKLINDGVITYELYQEIKDDPDFAQIEDAWDEYNCGIDGILEAEIAPYVDVIDDMLDNIWYLINNAVLYDEEPPVRADTKLLKESELLQIEKYLYLQDEIEKATKDADTKRYISFKKQFDLLESRLKYRKNLNLNLAIILAKMMNITRSIYDGTIPEFQKIQHDALNLQLSSLLGGVDIGNLAMRTVIYSSFMGQYSNVLSLKRNYKNVANTTIRGRTFKTTVTDARLYKDVAVPSMIELTYMNESAMGNAVGSVVTSGIQRMTKLYQKSVLSAKNLMESDVSIVNNLVNKIYEKYKARTMYKLMGK